MTQNADVRDFIARMQADPATATGYLASGGEELDVQLAGSDWTSTARTLREGDRVVACAFATVEGERAFVCGPWVDPGVDDPVATGIALLVAMASQAPGCRLEIFGEDANELFAGIASALGWEPPYIERIYHAKLGALTSPQPAGVSVRRAGPDDQADVSRLYRAEFPNSACADERLISALTTLVAEVDGGVVGFATGCPGDDEDVVRVEWMAVDPEYRRRGIGAWLLGETARAASTSATTLELDASEAKPSLCRWYETLGFTQVRRVCDYRGVIAG